MNALWRDDVASFDGEFVHLAPSWSWPKPVQRPRPRTLLGGGGSDGFFRDIAEYGDGWMPIGGSGLREALPRLRKAFADAGRDPEAIEVVLFGTEPTQGKLEHLRAVGVTEVALRLSGAGPDDMLRILDAYTVFL